MLRVASLGECMVELRHQDATTLGLAYGGDTLNTAVYLARLTAGRGVEVSYVTALGDDPYSEMMLEGWRAEGIRTERVARLPGRLPGLYVIRTDPAGERRFHYWRSAAAAREMLRVPGAESLLAELAGFDLLYVSGVTLSILDPGQRARLLDLAAAVRRSGGRVAFDRNYRPIGWPDPATARDAMTAMLRVADIALPTFDDEERLFGDPDPEACARRLAGLGVGEVAVKLGADGCHLQGGGFTGRIAAGVVEKVVDSTAAGDSFNAAYLAARLEGLPAEVAGRRGNRLAAEVIRHPGAIMPQGAMPDLDREAAGGKSGR